ncbi:NACHT, LRR and PYD domains-containing protein 3-like [Mantella aurantiaca]
MATSSFSSQGSAPGDLVKRQQTPGDLIINSLEDLTEYHFKKFRNKLSDFSYGDKRPIPKGRLENSDWTTTKDVLIDTYGEERALDVTTDILKQIGLMGPANHLMKRRADNAKLKKMTHNNKITDIRKEYRECVKEMFLRIKEYNSGEHPGETVPLQKRYTKLLMRKGRQNKEDKEEEISCSDRRHLQTMEKRSSDEYSPTTIQALFDPDEDGFIPKIVVLQGPAGIGKTMTSKKIMLDWAKESLYKDKFDFVFYLSCREINTITGNITLVGLLSRTCKLQCSHDLVSILKDPGSHRKLLFIVDGFDELRWTVEEKSNDCFNVFGETHKEILLQRLLRKQIISQSSLIITTRSLAMQKLNTFIDDSRNVEVLGFTGEDREEYVHKFFGNEEDADKVLSILKGNDILYTMCAVPVTCWIVCTIMKPEIKKDLRLSRCDTMTSIYLLYLEVLITHHSKKDQSVERKPRAIHTCLRKLCTLANEGVLSQQILFEEQDLKIHRLSLSEVESVFLNKNIFHQDVRTQTCYSFIHLSVQEFFAALYYGLDDSFGFLKGIFLPKICKGNSLSNLDSCFPHLSLAVQFLYGLLNKKAVKTFSENTGINISLRARSAMKQWAYTNAHFIPSTPYFFCLYETQDEDFIRSIMSCSSDFRLTGSYTGHNWMKINYSKQLNYCLTLKTESFQSLCFKILTVDPECQKMLSPLLHRCQKVRIFSNEKTFDLLSEERRLALLSNEIKLDLLSFQIVRDSIETIKTVVRSLLDATMDCLVLWRLGLRTGLENRQQNRFSACRFQRRSEDILSECNVEDTREPANLSFLINQQSTIQELSLCKCGLTSSCCDVLRSILITNQSLITLDLSYNNLQKSGIKLLCEGLSNPHCILQVLSLTECGLTSSSCDDLRSALITNRSLTGLCLSGNYLQDSGVKLLCEGLKHPDCTLQQLM